MQQSPMNRNMQEDCDKAYQHRVEERMTSEEERKYHFYWWMDFKSLPPKAPWERGWENIFSHLLKVNGINPEILNIIIIQKGDCN